MSGSSMKLLGWHRGNYWDYYLDYMKRCFFEIRSNRLMTMLKKKCSVTYIFSVKDNINENNLVTFLRKFVFVAGSSFANFLN